MKKYLGFMAVLSVVFTASPAHAVVVDFDGLDMDMGTVAYDQTGTLNNNFSVLTSGHPPLDTDTETAFGLLPAYSSITFTYHMPSMVSGGVTATGSYDFFSGPDHYVGTAIASSDGSSSSTATVNGIASTALVLSIANITGPNGATTTISNLSGALANFSTYFHGILHQGSLQLTYAVSRLSVSQVPLPASLPLLGVAMAGLVGIARRRKAAA